MLNSLTVTLYSSGNYPIKNLMDCQWLELGALGVRTVSNEGKLEMQRTHMYFYLLEIKSLVLVNFLVIKR
jgi:hypothetical protein